MFVLYGLVTDFQDEATLVSTTGGVAGVAPQYQFFSDMLLIAVLGFGFLMTFLRKYQYSAIGFTLLTVAFTFQWGLIVTQVIFF